MVFEQVSVAAVQPGVEVAERSLAKRWGFAAAAVGFDVAAESLGHDIGSFVVVVTHPLPFEGILRVRLLFAIG